MKIEFPPLFQAGFHEIDLVELEKISVFSFLDNTRRKYVFDRFKEFLSQLESIGIKFEMWIDGSFTTEKVEPSDVDLVVFFDPKEIGALSSDLKRKLSDLVDNRFSTKFRYRCDVLPAMNDNQEMRSYWRGWFGFSRDDKPKGIVKLKN